MNTTHAFGHFLRTLPDSAVATFLALFPIVDPFGGIPIFFSLTAEWPARDRRNTAIKTAVYVFGILVVFLFFGRFVLYFFGISLPVLKIAGGLIVANTACCLKHVACDHDRRGNKWIQASIISICGFVKGIIAQNLDNKALGLYAGSADYTASALTMFCSFAVGGKVRCHTTSVVPLDFKPPHPFAKDAKGWATRPALEGLLFHRCSTTLM